jgi:hypothetical protein
MKTQIFLALCMSMLVAVGCSHRKEKKVENQMETAAVTHTTEYTTISFDRGQKDLSELNKHYLTQLAEKAEARGHKVEEIKVLAWGDKEYSENKSATTAEVDLAKTRAKNIKEYLQSNLPARSNIDSINMAKKPNKWDELIESDSYKAQEAFQTEHMTSKASKAMVIFEFERI